MALSITYPTFTAIDQARIDRLKELLAAVIQAYNPDLDTRRGTVHDLVLHPRALLAAATEQGVLNALAATSLADLIADPTVGDEESVNRVLGNYRLVRKPAAKATGTVAIVISTLTPVVIPGGTAVTISGVSFVTTRSYAARTSSGQVTGPGDVLLRAVTGGYLFDVDVIASSVGIAGNVRRGTTATLGQNPPGFVRAYADVDFTGGADSETNSALLNRLAAGLAARAWSNRPSIEAAMREYSQTVEGVTTQPFASIQTVSIVGCGDPEMTRDQHSLFPISSGGRADLYVRSDTTYQTVRKTVTASLVSKVGAVGTWQFGLGKDDVPGFYEIKKVLLPGGDPTSSGWTPSSDVRALDLTGTTWKPLIATTVEGVYSRYQTTVVQFADTVTNATSLTIGSTKSYDVLVTAMPLIGAIQDFWNLLENRPPAGDVLVRAPVPCFTGVSLTLEVNQGTTVDVASVQSMVASVINAVGFTGRISGSSISKTLHAAIAGLSTVSGYAFAGRIRRLDGTTVNITGTDSLAIPSDSANGVGARTTAFLTTPSDVSVSVTTLDTPGA